MKPIDTRQEEVTTLDPELEEALSSATDTELCDLAGKRGRIKKEHFSCEPNLCWDCKTQAPFTLTVFPSAQSFIVCDDGRNKRAYWAK